MKILLMLSLFISISTAAQLGAGSYRDGLPASTSGPAMAPRVTADFSGFPSTNDWASSVNFPFFNSSYSAPLFAYPALFQTEEKGLVMGYKTSAGVHENGYIWGIAAQLRLGVSGLSASEVRQSSIGDWTIGIRWNGAGRQLDATIGHGMPFAYCRIEGGDAQVEALDAPQVWFQEGGVVGLTVQGVHYGLFSPAGSSWSRSGNSFLSNLGGKGYYSVALLPDNRNETLQRFAASAFRFVTGSEVSWQLDTDRSEVVATYKLKSQVMEGSPAEAPQALLRHQWLILGEGLFNVERNAYTSPRGEMVLRWGDQFETQGKFDGIVPSFPVAGLTDDASRQKLEALLVADIQKASENPFPSPDTYFRGKELAKYGALVRIADGLGRADLRDQLLGWIKTDLEDWFTYSGDGDARYFAYDPTWKMVVGIPASFNTNDQVNDHHFHYGYFIQAAAVVAQFDPGWANRWGPMVELLIRDANGGNRSDPLLPALRNFDPYVGHGWASGHGAFGDGNNQESVSEGLNFSAGVFLWGSATGNRELRDLGAYLFHTERMAAEQYWFDMDNAVFPAEWEATSTSIVWGGKSDYATWFSAEPEMIQGIIMLPISWHTLSLGRRPDYCQRNYNYLIQRNGGVEDDWVDVIWQYQAFFNPNEALSKWNNNPDYGVEQGETKTKTFLWLKALQQWGTLDTTVQANFPTAVVMKNRSAERRYIAWNPNRSEERIFFSNGKSVLVGAGELLIRRDGEMEEGIAALHRSLAPVGTPAEMRFRAGSLQLQTAERGLLRQIDGLGRVVQSWQLSAGEHAIPLDRERRGVQFWEWRGVTGERLVKTFGW